MAPIFNHPSCNASPTTTTPRFILESAAGSVQTVHRGPLFPKNAQFFVVKKFCPQFNGAIQRWPERMRDQLKRRRADFEGRASYSPKSFYTHRRRGFRYIPIHHFADEGVSPPEGESVDAWCELPTDVALLESWTSKLAERPAGIWIRRDEEAPQFLKIMVVFDSSGVTRPKFEEVMELVVDHPLAVDGFASVLPGSALSPLPSK